MRVPRRPERRLGLLQAIGHPAVRAVRRCARHSITSSARSIIDGGMTRPSAVAALRFTTISNFVGSCTGRLPGFSPRRMRSTYEAARRWAGLFFDQLVGKCQQMLANLEAELLRGC